MKTINVHTSKQYNVHIGSGLLQGLCDYISFAPNTKKVAIVSDSNVWPIYGSVVLRQLEAAGYAVSSFVFPAGETSKNGQTYLNILNFLAENKLTRTDVLIALGGGVVGDITGFAAATYLRGIDFIQIPTSLLAMVDSSVGGKTAIDLPAGKNLAGAFYQPALVLCDTETLLTLPNDTFRDGCAEVIKYAVLYDAELFDHLYGAGLSFDREAVIARCIALKASVVTEDEFDSGARQMLNFGHTFGHGIEAQSNFSVSHGKAVAIGMSMITKACVTKRICPAEVFTQLVDLLTTFGLPYSTTYSADSILQSALSDKKRSADKVNLIIPKTIGECQILPTPVSELKSFIEAGL